MYWVNILGIFVQIINNVNGEKALFGTYKNYELEEFSGNKKLTLYFFS